MTILKNAVCQFSANLRNHICPTPPNTHPPTPTLHSPLTQIHATALGTASQADRKYEIFSCRKFLLKKVTIAAELKIHIDHMHPVSRHSSSLIWLHAHSTNTQGSEILTKKLRFADYREIMTFAAKPKIHFDAWREYFFRTSCPSIQCISMVCSNSRKVATGNLCPKICRNPKKHPAKKEKCRPLQTAAVSHHSEMFTLEGENGKCAEEI